MRLFLDDDNDRHKAFVASCMDKEGVVCVYNVAQARKALEDYPRFDVVHLDHDLGDFGPVFEDQPRIEFTGYDVAKHIAGMPIEKRPGCAVIHSWNPDGARRMQAVLEEAGVIVTIAPFEF